jgi:hypothetical protein
LYTSQFVAGNSRRFIVRDGVVTSFVVTMTRNDPAGNACTNTLTLSLNVPIADSRFTFSADVRATTSVPYHLYGGPVTGTFDSGTSGSLTEGRAGAVTPADGGSPVAFIPGVLCGSSVTFGQSQTPATLAIAKQ